MAGQTFTLRSTLELAERLARRSLGNVEGYWPAIESSMNVINLDPAERYDLGSFTKMLAETDAENSLIIGWDVVDKVCEMPVSQVLVLTGPLQNAFVRNAASNGSPAAKIRILRIS